MPHLMFNWLKRLATRTWPGRSVAQQPLREPVGTPYDTLAPDGTRYVSWADWLCPTHCIEPATCPVIRAPRMWEMSGTAHAVAKRLAETGEVFGPALFVTRHLTDGVGAFAIDDAVASARAARRGWREWPAVLVADRHGLRLSWGTGVVGDRLSQFGSAANLPSVAGRNLAGYTSRSRSDNPSSDGGTQWTSSGGTGSCLVSFSSWSSSPRPVASTSSSSASRPSWSASCPVWARPVRSASSSFSSRRSPSPRFSSSVTPWYSTSRAIRRATEIDQLVGEVAIVTDELQPGAVGKVELRGTNWSARTSTGAVLPRGTRCRVTSVDGLTLSVEPEGAGQ